MMTGVYRAGVNALVRQELLPMTSAAHGGRISQPAATNLGTCNAASLVGHLTRHPLPAVAFEPWSSEMSQLCHIS